MDDVAYVDEGSMDAASKLFIDVVFSECFYFQLNSQPSWQAVSYYYMVNSLRPKLKPNAIIVPCKAKIMCAAVQLPDLYRSHGLVGRYDLNVSEVYLFLIANQLFLFLACWGLITPHLIKYRKIGAITCTPIK
jgi:hypothetical protein